MQYHSKATDTVCSIKLKREEFLYMRTIFNFQAECVLIYMLLFYQISPWVFLIHMFLYAGFYCSQTVEGLIIIQSETSRPIVSIWLVIISKSIYIWDDTVM